MGDKTRALSTWDSSYLRTPSSICCSIDSLHSANTTKPIVLRYHASLLASLRNHSPGRSRRTYRNILSFSDVTSLCHPASLCKSSQFTSLLENLSHSSTLRTPWPLRLLHLFAPVASFVFFVILALLPILDFFTTLHRCIQGIIQLPRISALREVQLSSK